MIAIPDRPAQRRALKYLASLPPATSGKERYWRARWRFRARRIPAYYVDPIYLRGRTFR